MASLILYVTEHCSLCDAAFDLLLNMPEAAGLPLSVLDIATAEDLCAADFDRLGPRLPVLGCRTNTPGDPELQLDWPFTAQQVLQLLRRQPVG